MKTQNTSGLTPPANAGPPAWLLQRLEADFRHGRTFICSRCGILTPDEFCEGHGGSPLRSPLCKRCVNADSPPERAASHDPHTHDAAELVFPALTLMLATNARARAARLQRQRRSRKTKTSIQPHHQSPL